MRFINRLRRLSKNQKIILSLSSFTVLSAIGLIYFFGITGGSIVSQADTVNGSAVPEVAGTPDISESITNSAVVAEPDNTAISSNLTPSTNSRVAQLPANIQPLSSPQPQKSVINFYKSDTMASWSLWLMYGIIPAFLSFGVIYFYFRRKKYIKNNII